MHNYEGHSICQRSGRIHLGWPRLLSLLRTTTQRVVEPFVTLLLK